MKKCFFILCLASMMTAAFAQQSETVYSWMSPSGTVSETGGVIVQHNLTAINRINCESSGYYTIQLCGKKEMLTAEDNTLDAIYFTITLADSKTFKSGDKITITAMRNNDDGGKSNIHFLYGNGTTYDDTNVWANLGKLHEVIFNGGTGAKSGSGISGTNSIGGNNITDAGAEPLTEYSLVPSTNTFVVPADADGSTSLTLTRNESECKLYITEIDINRDIPTAIGTVQESGMNIPENTRYDLLGRMTNAKGIVIVNGKKMINK